MHRIHVCILSMLLSKTLHMSGGTLKQVFVVVIAKECLTGCSPTFICHDIDYDQSAVSRLHLRDELEKLKS